MKIYLNKKPAAVVLIVALFVILGAGVVLASYLTLMSNETRSVARSQIWNQCVPVMEAGVEEAMAQIQYCGNTTNFSGNNWKLYADGFYHKTNTVGTNGSYCGILIQPVLPPVIYATAYVPIPDTATNYLSRKVRVYTTNSFGSGGLIAKSAITMTGSAQVDSYNSLIAPYDPKKPGTNAIVKTDSTAAGAIKLAGSSKIYGLAVTGPGGSVAWSGGSTVGDVAWIAGNNPGVESGWSANDANFRIDDNPAPDTSGWITINTNNSALKGKLIPTGTNYTYLLNNANYVCPGLLSLSGGTEYMAISGNVKLYVQGAFGIYNSAYVYITPGSTLTLYAGGAVDISGAGIANGNGSTSALTIIGLTNCPSVQYNNSGVFVGSVNAPEAALQINGDGGAYGAFTANTIIIGNSGKVHYDQALGGSQYFTAGSWNEL